jgi:hypothetical protein
MWRGRPAREDLHERHRDFSPISALPFLNALVAAPTAKANLSTKLETNHWKTCKTRKMKNTLNANAKCGSKFVSMSHPSGVLLLSIVMYDHCRLKKSTIPKR